MGLFSFLFKKNTEPVESQEQSVVDHKCGCDELKDQIDSLQREVKTIHIAVSSHQTLINRNYDIIKQHTGKLQSLEDKLTCQQNYDTNIFDSPIKQSTCRDRNLPIHNPPAIEQTPKQQSGKLELSHFTPQEKKILSIFFNDRDMQLSYADIGRTMGKSPHTIKNHIRQMRMKADIFRQSITNEGRKRFQLKDGLEIQNYLNVNQAD